MAKNLHPWQEAMRKGERQAAYFIFVGVNGTGKTTQMKSMLPVNKRNLILPSNMLDASKSWGQFPVVRPTHSHVADTIRDGSGKKTRRIWQVPGIRAFRGNLLVDTQIFTTTEYKNEFFQSLCDVSNPSRFSDGGMFIDDTRGYIPSKGNLPELVANMLIGRRHLMVDLCMAFHAFQDVNSDLIKYGPKFFIFKTDLPPNDTVLDKIALSSDLLEAIQYVNERAKKEPYYNEPFDPVNGEANDWVRKNMRK
jgi:hypothetical protein